MPLLAKLIPFRDWLYAGIAVAAVIFWFHHDHVEQVKGAAAVSAAVQTATAKAEHAAQLRINDLDQQYAATAAKVKDDYEKQLADASNQHDADLKRLRERAAGHSSVNAAVEGASTPAAGSAGSAASAEGLGDVPAGLGLELADALRHDYAELQQCWAERDSLTGK
jgi:hypothetical protein